MITYFYDENGVVYMTDFGYIELTEKEQQNPMKIQLEKPYKIPEEKGKKTVLYVEEGQLKHRYETIEVEEDEKLKKLEEKTSKTEKEVTNLENKVKSVQLAVAEWYATEDTTTASVGDSGETI